jgi:hypothetical protein
MEATPMDLSRATWRKSARSSSQSNNCVEVAPVREHIAVRDSKNPEGATLIFDRDAWRTFSIWAKRGRFDG